MGKNEIEKRQLTKDEIRSGKVSREGFRKLKRNPIYLLLDSAKIATTSIDYRHVDYFWNYGVLSGEDYRRDSGTI